MLDMRSLSGHRWTYLGLFALRFVWFRLGTPPKEFFQPDPNPSQFPLDSQPLLSSPPSRSPSKGRNGPRAAHDMRAPCCPISRLHRDLPEDRFTEQMVSNRSAGSVACRHGPSRRPRSEDGSEVSTVDGPVEDLYWPGHLEGGKSEPLARFLYKGPVDLGVSREREREIHPNPRMIQNGLVNIGLASGWKGAKEPMVSIFRFPFKQGEGVLFIF